MRKACSSSKVDTKRTITPLILYVFNSFTLQYSEIFQKRRHLNSLSKLILIMKRVLPFHNLLGQNMRSSLIVFDTVFLMKIALS